MTDDLTSPIYTNEEAARRHFEAQRWPDGPICPHCGTVGNAHEMDGQSTRPGVYKCRECEKQFSVTVGTVMERSHIGLHKWLLAMHLLCASKKGMSAHQLHRMLGITYKSTWFMAMRIREAMGDPMPAEGGAPLGGKGKVVEADETYIGGKESNKHKSKRTPGRQGGAGKAPVLSLVERGGKVRSRHVADVTGKTLRDAMVTQIDRASYLMTDDAPVYTKIGDEFEGHGTVNHSAEEYVRAYFWHTNTVEGYFSILKRGIIGVYHHVSEGHLHRYLTEFDFRYNERSALGVEDTERMNKAIRGVAGKRLTYRQPDLGADAQA